MMKRSIHEWIASGSVSEDMAMRRGLIELVRCRDYRHFSVKDHWGIMNGVPILAASDVPTCDAWANTECMVDPDGYCFLGGRKEGIEDDAGKA